MKIIYTYDTDDGSCEMEFTACGDVYKKRFPGGPTLPEILNRWAIDPLDPKREAKAIQYQCSIGLNELFNSIRDRGISTPVGV